MKLVRTFPPILILFLLIIGSTQSSSSATALDQGASARGEGEFLFFTGFRTELFHFAFDVRANKHRDAHRIAADHVRSRRHYD